MPKELTLPGHEQFIELVSETRRVPFGPGLASADLVEFLAYGGFRKGEASHAIWSDCDFKRREILVRGNAETGTKNGEMRRVPMIADIVQLLERLRAARPADSGDAAVMRVKECQGGAYPGMHEAWDSANYPPRPAPPFRHLLH